MLNISTYIQHTYKYLISLCKHLVKCQLIIDIFVYCGLNSITWRKNSPCVCCLGDSNDKSVLCSNVDPAWRKRVGERVRSNVVQRK